jgi:hypothetical protein
MVRKPTGNEVGLEIREFDSLETQDRRLSPRELGLLARKLATAKSLEEAAQVRDAITRGFYGVRNK